MSGKVLLGALSTDDYRLLFSAETGAIDWSFPFGSLIKLPPELDPRNKRELSKRKACADRKGMFYLLASR